MMERDAKQSLRQSGFGSWLVPACLLVSALLLIAGLILPIMHTEKLLFWHDDYSLIDGIIALVKEEHYLLAIILFFFSVIFPTGKLIVLGALWFVPITHDSRRRVLKWLAMLGKWSMLDVFVVAVLIVITQLGGVLNAEARIGIYLFAAAIAGSMIATHFVERTAKSGRTTDDA